MPAPVKEELVEPVKVVVLATPKQTEPEDEPSDGELAPEPGWEVAEGFAQTPIQALMDARWSELGLMPQQPAEFTDFRPPDFTPLQWDVMTPVKVVAPVPPRKYTFTDAQKTPVGKLWGDSPPACSCSETNSTGPSAGPSPGRPTTSSSTSTCSTLFLDWN